MRGKGCIRQKKLYFDETKGAEKVPFTELVGIKGIYIQLLKKGLFSELVYTMEFI